MISADPAHRFTRHTVSGPIYRKRKPLWEILCGKSSLPGNIGVIGGLIFEQAEGATAAAKLLQISTPYSRASPLPQAHSLSVIGLGDWIYLRNWEVVINLVRTRTLRDGVCLKPDGPKRCRRRCPKPGRLWRPCPRIGVSEPISLARRAHQIYGGLPMSHAQPVTDPDHRKRMRLGAPPQMGVSETPVLARDIGTFRVRNLLTR